MWHGQIVDIPNGWALCNGQNDTPDLRSKFIRGVRPGLNPGGTGGSLAHDHTADIEEEADFLASGNIISGYEEELYWDEGTEGHSHFITINPADHKPPYYELAFIIKL